MLSVSTKFERILQIMKRILCAIIAGAMCATIVFAFAGCGCSNKNEPGYTIEATKPDLTNNGFGYYIVNSNELMVTEYTGNEKNLVVPDSYNNYKVTSIGPNAFSDKDIESVTIPDTVTEIEGHAFQACTKLKSVTLSKNLKTFGNNVFFLCTSLEEVTVPASVTDLGLFTFQGSGGKTVTIEEGSLEEIREYVFYQCPEIKEINIPANVTKMSEYSVCDNKNTVTINAPKGSYAENYVKTYGKTNKLEFKAVE